MKFEVQVEYWVNLKIVDIKHDTPVIGASETNTRLEVQEGPFAETETARLAMEGMKQKREGDWREVDPGNFKLSPNTYTDIYLWISEKEISRNPIKESAKAA